MQATGSKNDRRALVIEGDSGIRQGICDVLARRGFQVSACDSLGQGREFYRQHPLVVTGCSHENGDVQEFVHFVREKSVAAQPYIITLKNGEEAAHALPGAGVNDIVALPLNDQMLELKIDAANAWLASRDLSRPVEPAEPAPADPAPINPAPADPAPINPAPVDPAPINPAPVDPAPINPAPVDPAPINPAPVDPAPINPAPVDPAPADPAPADPAPADPAPADPAPADPAPADPAPADPAPAEPAPVEPVPVDPAPAEPAEAAPPERASEADSGGGTPEVPAEPQPVEPSQVVKDFVPDLTPAPASAKPLAAVSEKAMLTGTTRYHLAVLLEESPLAMAMFDKSMRYIIANERWKRAFGLEKDDVIGRSHYEIFSEVSDTWQDLCTRCTGRNAEQVGRELVEWADGTREWVKWVMRPWQYEDGMSGGIVVSFDPVEDAAALVPPPNEFETDLAAALAQSNTTPVLVLDSHGRIVRSNHMARELGVWNESYDDERFYWQVYLGKDARAAAQEAFINFACDLLEKNEFAFVPTSVDDVPCADGRAKRIAWHNLPRHDAEGKINGMIRIGVDVGELSSGDLPDSSSAESWIDNVPNLHWKARRDGKIVFFNRAWLEFRGRTEEEECDNGWLDGLHEDDHHKVIEAFGEIEEYNGRLNQLARLQNSEGDYRWMHFVIPSGRYGNAPESETYIGFCEDVTAQKHLDEELSKLQGELEKKDTGMKALQQQYDSMLGDSARVADNVRTQEDRAAALDQELGKLRAAGAKVTEERNRFAAIPENAPFGIVVLGADGKLLYTNPAHVGVVGSEIKGHPDLESWMRAFCPEENENAVEQFIEDWRENVWRKQLTKVYPLLTADESIRDLEFRPRMMRDGQFLLSIFDVTDPQRGEKALRASEAKFRTFFYDSGVAMALVDRKGAIVDVNSATEKLIGRSHDVIMKGRVEDVIVGEDRPRRDELLEHLAQSQGRAGDAAVRVLAANGTELPVQMNVSLVKDSEGTVLFTAYFFNPLPTLPEPPSPEPVETVSPLPDASPDLIIIADSDGVILNLIPSAAVGSRIDPSRASGMRVSDLFPGIGVEMKELGARAAESGGVAVQPFSLIENQTERHYECRVATSGPSNLTIIIRDAPAPAPLPAPESEPPLAPAPVSDDGNVMLDEAVKRQALAFAHIHDGVVIADLKGRIIDWNPGAERIFGYAKEEIVGKGLYHLYDQDDPKRFKIKITQGIAKARRWEEEASYIRKDGSTGRCEAIYVPLLNEEGAPIALVGVNRDLKHPRSAAGSAPVLAPAPTGVPAAASQGGGEANVVHGQSSIETIASLLDLQLDAAKDRGARKAVLASHGRVEALAMLQRQAVDAGGQSQIDFGKYVRSLVQHLLEEVGPEETAIEVHLNVKNIALPYDVASSLATSLNELLTNALTHAFAGRDNGVVGVSVSLAGNGGRMVVKDDGSGLPDWLDIADSPGLGLKIVRKMADKLGGNVQTSDGPDTEFQIGFQLIES